MKKAKTKEMKIKLIQNINNKYNSIWKVKKSVLKMTKTKMDKKKTV